MERMDSNGMNGKVPAPHIANIETLRDAIERNDPVRLAAFYADDARLTIIDHERSPSRPLVLSGKDEIKEFWNNICSRDMTHHVTHEVAEGNRMAFTEECTCSDGMRVVCSAFVETRNGQITRETMVQAWDEAAPDGSNH